MYMIFLFWTCRVMPYNSSFSNFGKCSKRSASKKTNPKSKPRTNSSKSRHSWAKAKCLWTEQWWTRSSRMLSRYSIRLYSRAPRATSRRIWIISIICEDFATWDWNNTKMQKKISRKLFWSLTIKVRWLSTTLWVNARWKLHWKIQS